ncbi:MAG: Xaa-Pro peptidase family protein [Methanomassiliicoccaceae archaeon]|jgi:Xaa-Pro dipeptidase|nr:Xaa-Pro peptidase family protein [Methanomassiliicoccaceae archaeon]
MNRALRIIENCETADAVVISNGTSPFLDPLFWYVTEQTSGSFEGTIAIISKDGSLDVITGALEETTAKKGRGNVHIYGTRDERDHILMELLRGCASIGVRSTAITHGASENLKRVTGAELVDVSAKISEVVMIKDMNEIADIRKACSISSKVASRIPSMLRSDITEKDMSRKIDEAMRKYGGDGNAFDTIAAFGSHSAEPHHRPTEHKLRKGDAALFDFGSRYGMYSSDLTRTVFFGEPDGILERAYETVLKAKEAGMKEMYDGAPAKNADAAARDVIDAGEFKGLFIHSFGHGIGMNVHEGPSVSSRSDDILKEGMIVSAEPGIYIPGIGGIRIEDTVLITKSGAEALTKFDHSYTVI